MSEREIQDASATMRVAIDLALEPTAAFDLLVEELVATLADQGIRFMAHEDGRLTQDEFEVGRVTHWQPGRGFQLQWRRADWQPDETTEIELRLEPAGSGTHVVLEHKGWGSLIGDPGELAGWFARELAAAFLQITTPKALGNWLINRHARRPSGPQSRSVYRDPLYHYPNFRVILAELALTSADYLLEVGCGGVRSFSRLCKAAVALLP